jgi:hypothetical protein
VNVIGQKEKVISTVSPVLAASRLRYCISSSAVVLSRPELEDTKRHTWRGQKRARKSRKQAREGIDAWRYYYMDGARVEVRLRGSSDAVDSRGLVEEEDERLADQLLQWQVSTSRQPIHPPFCFVRKVLHSLVCGAEGSTPSSPSVSGGSVLSDRI